MRAGGREVGKRQNVGKEPLQALTTDQIFILHGLKKVTSELVWPFVMRGEEKRGVLKTEQKMMYQFQKKREEQKRKKKPQRPSQNCVR